MTNQKTVFSAAIFLLIGCGLFGKADAEVVSAKPTGFTIEMDADVVSSTQAAYEQFIQPQDWWNPEHSWFGDAANFSLEANAGGCFCEKNGKAEVEHLRVVFVNPGKEIRLLGGLGPLQEMGLSGAMTWKFEAIDQGKTKITQRYTVTGYIEGGLEVLAPIVDKVQTEQLTRLVDRLNTKN